MWSSVCAAASIGPSELGCDRVSVQGVAGDGANWHPRRLGDFRLGTGPTHVRWSTYASWAREHFVHRSDFELNSFDLGDVGLFWHDFDRVCVTSANAGAILGQCGQNLARSEATSTNFERMWLTLVRCRPPAKLISFVSISAKFEHLRPSWREIGADSRDVSTNWGTWPGLSRFRPI